MDFAPCANGLPNFLGLITRPILLVCTLIAFPTMSEPAAAQQKAKQQKGAVQQDSLLDLFDQIDKQEQQEFVEHQQAAKACIAAQDFACAERYIALARKVAGSTKEKREIGSLQQNLADAKTAQVEAEKQERRARQKAAEDEAEREERREARAEEEKRRQWAAEARERANRATEYSPPERNQFVDFLIADGEKQTARMRQAQAERANAERKAEEARREQRDEHFRQQAADARRQSVSADSRQKETGAIQRAQQERERQRLEAERAAAQAQQEASKRRERELAEEQRRKKEADRLAAAEAEKVAKERATRDYMSAMVSGIRLAAINCFGSTEVTGGIPKMPGGSRCIDVYYTARCTGDSVGTNGVLKNFIGGSGCYGDTSTVSPKPACKADAVVVQVTDVRPGCGGN